MKVWKWKLEVTDRQTLTMPVGVQLLDVQMQGNDCCLWALCDESADLEPRRIAIYGTGNPMPDDPGKYIGTFQLYGGNLVFHAFDLGRA
jgi:hypothetical protein